MTHESGTQLDDDPARLRRRDPAAIERWFLDHADALYTFVYYRVHRDEHLACDVVQETFTVALREIHRYDPARGTMAVWLTTLSRNVIRKALTDKRQFEGWEKANSARLIAYRNIDQVRLPQETLEHHETSELVQLTLRTIPQNYREVLRQHYYNDQPLCQIAQSLKTTEGAVKSLLHRARLTFKETFVALAGPILSTVPIKGGSRDYQ